MTPQAPPLSISMPRKSRRGLSSWEIGGAVASTRAAPKPRPTTFGRGFGLRRRQAATPSSRGSSRLTQPSSPNPAAAISAPTPPIQLRVAPA